MINSMNGMRLPLSRGENNKRYLVVKIAGKSETIKHINDLGLLVDSEITLISSVSGNMILNVKGARIGIGKELADKVTVIELT